MSTCTVSFWLIKIINACTETIINDIQNFDFTPYKDGKNIISCTVNNYEIIGKDIYLNIIINYMPVLGGVPIAAREMMVQFELKDCPLHHTISCSKSYTNFINNIAKYHDM